MTPRERFISTLKFEPCDRVPLMPGGGRESTLAAWRAQGLAPDRDPFDAACEILGIERERCRPVPHHGVCLTMIPEFEERIIERRPAPVAAGTLGVGVDDEATGTLIVQDWKGNICEISDRFDPTYLRGAPDFVTRSWLRCPVTGEADWPDMARRYDAASPGRFPDDFADRGRQLAERDGVSAMVFSGPFWQLREWVGFEPLCIMLLDEPDFVRRMIDFWRGFVSEMLTRTFRHHVPDYVMINEDMAYKEKPMISPDMARTFLAPVWEEWGEVCRGAGVPLYSVDSDGFIETLIPVWLEAGFKWTSPVEVAAGNDLVAMRERFGRRMAYSGGVDKRAIARGGRTLEREIDRIAPVVRSGGYIPGCDHGVPSDVSWDNYVDFCRHLARLTGWLD